MSAAKNRKIDDEGRVFNSEWCSKHPVVQHNQGVVCLVCQNTIAVIKNIMLNAITQLSTLPILMKFFVRREWTKLNI